MHTHERTQRWLSLPRVAWGSALSLQLRPLLSSHWYTTCLELSHWLKTLSHQSICLSPTRPFICSLLSLRPTHQPLTLKWMRWRDGGLLYTRGWILFACIMLGPSDGSEEWRQAYYMYHSSFLDPILSLLSSSLLHAFCLSHTSGTILLFFFSLSSPLISFIFPAVLLCTSPPPVPLCDFLYCRAASATHPWDLPLFHWWARMTQAVCEVIDWIIYLMGSQRRGRRAHTCDFVSEPAGRYMYTHAAHTHVRAVALRLLGLRCPSQHAKNNTSSKETDVSLTLLKKISSLLAVSVSTVYMWSLRARETGRDGGREMRR